MLTRANSREPDTDSQTVTHPVFPHTDGNRVSRGLIVVLVILVVFILLVVGGLVFWFRKHR